MNQELLKNILSVTPRLRAFAVKNGIPLRHCASAVNKTVFLVFILIVFSSPLLHAQLSTKSKKAIELYTEADNYRVRGQFPQAIDLLNQAIAKDKAFVEAYYRLGLVYFNMKDYPKAIENLEKGATLTTDVRKKKVFWYDLGEAYLLTGEYEKSIKALSAYLNTEASNKQKIQQATAFYNSAKFALENKNNPSAFQQKTLSDTVNAFITQYFPVLTADQQELIFTRRMGLDMMRDDEDLVVSRKNEKGRWTTPVSISKNINTPLNEGTCTISADGRKLIFTSCAGRDGLGSCDLYESNKVGNEWSVPKNLGPNVNSASWESQPSLSADGRTLYFVSDRRSGYGRRDIWTSTLDPNGKWTKAINAGKPVNSQYDEISPFIHANNKLLYFASNGLPGFGGYDIFYVVRDSSGWSSPQNIGAPINNHDDQFSLFITADGSKGYYAHEEAGPQGNSYSKIVEVSIPEAQQIKQKSNYVRGIIRNKETKKPLMASVELINLKNNEVESLVQSDSITGDYLIILTEGSEYALYVSKSGYVFKSVNFNYTTGRKDPIVMDVYLDPVKVGSLAVLNNLFFDTDKYELKDKSQAELKKLVRFIRDNNVRVEISGHTDNVGSREYNLQLSKKRAEAVHQYLVREGVDSKKLVPKGYGPDQPVAENDTEAGRQLNRRIEFKIVK